MEQKRGDEKQRFYEIRGKLGQGMDILEKWGMEAPYETMMFTSTLQQENNRLTRFWSMLPFGTT